MEIRPNRVKRKLAKGESALIVSGFDSGDAIDAFGPNDFDGIWLEGEHGPVDAAQIGDLTRACDIWGMPSVVRVNRNDQNLIYRTLDRGALAIVVPHVDTKADAENVVEGGKFAPLGRRGMFISRQGHGIPNYVQVANDETALIVLIEDIVAINNLDEILTVDHIDVFFVAPGDLAATMGHVDNIWHPEVQEVVDRAIGRIQEAGRVAGTFGTDDNVAKYAAAGVRFFLNNVGTWIEAGAAAYKARAEAARQA